METTDGLPKGKGYWAGITKALSARFISLTRLEEASTVLYKLRIEEFRASGADDRTALTTVFSKIESTAPVALPFRRDSTAMLSFLNRSVDGTPWN